MALNSPTGQPDSAEHEVTLVVLGSLKTGKTSLVHRLLQLEIPDRYKPTVEEEYCCVYMTNEHVCKLKIIDTAGSYSFPAMQRLWLHKASAMVIVCSRDSNSSVLHLKTLLNDIKMERIDNEKIPIVVAINKQDLPLSEWVVEDESIEQVLNEVEKLNIPITRISSLNNENIDKIFKLLWEINENKPIYEKIIFPSNEKACRYSGHRSSIETATRRFSAFAVLNRNQGWKPQHASSPRTSRFNISLQDSLKSCEHSNNTSPTEQNQFNLDVEDLCTHMSQATVGSKKEHNTEETFSPREENSANKKWSFKNRFLSQKRYKTKQNDVGKHKQSAYQPSIELECNIS